MQYFGGKSKSAKEISNVLNTYIKDNMTYIEPFCGSAKIVCTLKELNKNKNVKYIAYDINDYLIEMFKALQNGWVPPKSLTKEEYLKIKENKDSNKPLASFAGFGCSFSGKWFGGYAKNNGYRNYALNTYNSLIRQQKVINDITFKTNDYLTLDVHNTLIYCDPPYKNTTGYGYSGKFDSDKFWNKMRELSKDNIVIISEYEAPDDFECIWSKEIKLNIRNKDSKNELRVEKLFKLKK